MRRVSLPELFDRARQALLSRAEAMFWIQKFVLPNPEKCFSTTPSPSTLFARLFKLMSVNPIMGALDIHAYPESDREKVLIRSADRAIEGCFNLLGLEGLAFGCPVVDWHFEPTNGRHTPKVAWKRLDSLEIAVTGDKKIVWELNRHQHLLTFGRAFLRTDNERYAKALGEHITKWIQENPPTLGINWVSKLDIAFRCISWLWALALIGSWRKSPSLPLLEIEQSLYLQGCHIERYLSTYFSPNTHLTGEALGLYYLGTCLPELKTAERWRNLGRSILLQQLEKQVRADGVYFEQSTWYHRYTADFYLHFILLAERAGESLPPYVAERLTKLLDYLMWITRPDGTSPNLGDDDGGKLMKLEERASSDWRAILSNGAVMFGRGDYKHVAGEFAEETYWLFGTDAREKFERLPAQPPLHNSKAFVDGGYFLMRSGWNPDSNYMLIDCGPHGAMNCGHAHADALAIEVAALGSTTLIDPGTFTYTGSTELRDMFRSTAMHNTLTIDGLSSSVPSGPFKWKHIAKCVLHCWHDHPGFTFFEGSHDGYKRLSDPALHTRTLLFVGREYWFMLDRVEATAEHEYTIHFHMATDIEITLDQETGRLTADAALANLDIIYFEEQGRWNVAYGLVSPCYAAKATAPIGTYCVRKTGQAALLSVLFPRNPEKPPPRIRNLNPKQGKGLGLEMSQFHDFVFWLGTSAPEEGLHETDFEWVWLRRSTSDSRSLIKAILIHGNRVSLQDFELTADQSLNFVTVSAESGLLSIDLSPSAGISIRLPTGTDRFMVNGRIHIVDSGRPLALTRKEIPELAVSRDQNERCRYVRH